MHYKICHYTNFPLPLLPMLAKVYSSSKINVIPACIPWILSFPASSHQKIQSGLICMVREEIAEKYKYASSIVRIDFQLNLKSKGHCG